MSFSDAAWLHAPSGHGVSLIMLLLLRPPEAECFFFLQKGKAGFFLVPPPRLTVGAVSVYFGAFSLVRLVSFVFLLLLAGA